jgi:hypothetical protein
MAVRNTKTGGARKRVAGETKKGGKTTQAKKPATKPVMTAGMLKRMQEKSAPKPTSSEAISTKRPNMNVNTPTGRTTPVPKTPATKPAVKKPVPAKQRPSNMDYQQISNSKRANYIKGTGTK